MRKRIAARALWTGVFLLGCGGGSLTGTGGSNGNQGQAGISGFGGFISAGSAGVNGNGGFVDTGAGGFGGMIVDTGMGGWTFDCGVPSADGGVPEGDGSTTTATQPPPAVGLLAPLAYHNSWPFLTAPGDVTGDGKADLVTITSRVSVQVNDGTGRFGAPVDFGAGLGAGDVAYPIRVADLDGDGNGDLIYAHSARYPQATVAVALGDGVGGFGPAADYPVAGVGSPALAIGDLDGDGDADIVTLGDGNGSPGEVDVLMNAGDGTFGPAAKYAAAGTAGRFAVGDLDGDGRDEVAVPSYAYDSVLVFWNRGNGQLMTPVTFPAGVSPINVAIGDITGDSQPDLVIVNQVDFTGDSFSIGGTASTVSVLRNLGTGGFATPRSYTVGIEAGASALADVNGDAKLDVVVVNQNSRDASVLYNQGNGTLAGEARIAVGGEPVDLFAAEMNGDGKPDLLFVNQAGDLVVALTTAQGALSAGANYPTGTWPTVPVEASVVTAGIAAGDVNGDGKLDLVATGTVPYDDGMKLLLNNGAGKFGAPLALDTSTSYSAAALAVLDLDGDGKADIVSGDSHPCVQLKVTSVAPPLPNCYEQGDNTLESVVVAMGDVNGDGRPDMALVRPSSIFILTNDGTGTFTEGDRLGGTGSSPVSATLANLTGDIRAELVVASAGSGSGVGRVDVFGAGPTGHFANTRSIIAGSVPAAIAVADLNGDGRPDIALANSTNGSCNGGLGTIDVLFADGTGSFLGSVRYGGGGYATIAAADIDGDGDADLVALDGWTTTGGVNVFLNDGSGRFGAPLHYATGSAPTSVTVADLNGDSRPDIAVATSRGALSVLLSGPR